MLPIFVVAAAAPTPLQCRRYGFVAWYCDTDTVFRENFSSIAKRVFYDRYENNMRDDFI